MCSAYMCVRYMVFLSDGVFEFFLALFLAEFNPQLSSLENLWTKSELFVLHTLLEPRTTNCLAKAKKKKKNRKPKETSELTLVGL
jgi:hypothetical protein